MKKKSSLTLAAHVKRRLSWTLQCSINHDHVLEITDLEATDSQDAVKLADHRGWKAFPKNASPLNENGSALVLCPICVLKKNSNQDILRAIDHLEKHPDGMRAARILSEVLATSSQNK